MTTVQFDKIFHGHGTELGKMRIGEKGMAWKVLEGDGQVQVPAGDIKWAHWLRVARNFQLRVGYATKKDGVADIKRVTFDGFQRDDFDKISQLFTQHYEVTVEAKDVVFKGWNWGATDFQGDDLAFLVSNKTAFEIPLGSVLNSNIAGKTEVSLEFAANGIEKKGQKAKPADEMVEIRFYVPGTHVKGAGSDDEGAVKVKKKPKKAKEGDEGSNASDEEDEEEEEESAAQKFHSLVRERVSVSNTSSADALLISFDNVLISTPRGRYDVDMYQTFLRIRGKTYDYKILYSSIKRLFLLPKDDALIHFVMGLDPPIRQGQTRYSYLVMQFSKDEEMEAEINLEEDVLEEKYGGKLQKHYDMPAFQVVTSIFRALTGKKVIGQTQDAAHGIKCSLKANPGELHLLEKMIIFIGKQPILIEHNDIEKVVFSRIAMSTARTFDFSIEADGANYTFNAFPKDEFEAIDSYLKSKKIRVTNQMADERMNELIGEDDDEEMQSVASSDDEVEPVVRKGADLDDEDSEEDEDFRASSTDGGSPTESSDEGSDSGSATSEKKAKSKPKSKPKEKEKEKGKEKEKEKGKDKEKEKGKEKSKAKDKDKDAAKPKATKKSGDGDKSTEKAKPKPKPKPKEKSDDGPSSSPPKKKKPAADGDGGDKEKPRPKPRPKAKPKDDDAMDIDDPPPSSSKPRSKPPSSKAASSKAPADDGPAKKKQKKDDSD